MTFLKSCLQTDTQSDILPLLKVLKLRRALKIYIYASHFYIWNKVLTMRIFTSAERSVLYQNHPHKVHHTAQRIIHTTSGHTCRGQSIPGQVKCIKDTQCQTSSNHIKDCQCQMRSHYIKDLQHSSRSVHVKQKNKHQDDFFNLTLQYLILPLDSQNQLTCEYFH